MKTITKPVVNIRSFAGKKQVSNKFP